MASAGRPGRGFDDGSGGNFGAGGEDVDLDDGSFEDSAESVFRL